MKELGGRGIVVLLGAEERVLVRRLRVEDEAEGGMMWRGCSESGERKRTVYLY